jgi:hypothetical protein
MLFSELAHYFSRLEETTKRNALVEILADLFSKTPEDEVASTTYLLQGRLAPFFKPIEIGMAPTTSPTRSPEPSRRTAPWCSSASIGSATSRGCA